MAHLIYALNQSLDGFVDHDRFSPDPVLFRHFIDDIASLAGSIYGRTMYEVMRYWDEDHPESDAAERAYADAWRSCPKWVVSSTLKSVGPNAQLIASDAIDAIRRIKAKYEGNIEVAGPKLASGLMGHGLIDEYRIYLHPAVLGHGARYFQAIPEPLRLVGHEQIGENVVRVRYAPA